MLVQVLLQDLLKSSLVQVLLQVLQGQPYLECSLVPPQVLPAPFAPAATAVEVPSALEEELHSRTFEAAVEPEPVQEV